MAYEIEVLSLGNADSTIIRYYCEKGLEWVILIDAGNTGDGKVIKSYIDKYTNQKYIDLAICTHPDNDHIGGFFYIVENIKINEFWIHDPSLHIKMDVLRKTISSATARKKLSYITESLDNSSNLLKLIDDNGIPRNEPFAELKHHTIPLKVLGPSRLFYEELLKGFRDVDSLIKEELFIENFAIQDISFDESLSDTLDADDDKSCENNSSAIVAFHPKNEIFLFTGDAGVIAIEKMMQSYPGISGIIILKVPHHGSKYNLSSKIIKALSPRYSIIPASGTRKYPSRAVVNALKKVGSLVYVTCDYNSLIYQRGFPSRIGYSLAVSR